MEIWTKDSIPWGDDVTDIESYQDLTQSNSIQLIYMAPIHNTLHLKRKSFQSNHKYIIIDPSYVQ